MTNIASEDLRRAWGASLDRALKGELLVVERHGRPMAVLSSFDQWSTLQDELTNLRRIVQADQDFADMRNGNYSEG